MVNGWTHCRIREYGVIELALPCGHCGGWHYSCPIPIDRIPTAEVDTLHNVPLEECERRDNELRARGEVK